MANEKTPQRTIVNVSTFVGSTYSQIVGVTVTDVDMTLEFVYINPSDKKIGQVVSRVTLPLAVGVDLAQTILTTSRVHENKKKGVSKHD
ncbi:hypothetical protein HGB07_08320 [Candidatus Roizmanbacteria bacterium]|nr:hypothetical protein [Candidatus Roizmanbacteria bacterium]